MNIFAIIILLAILVDFFVGLVTNMMNIKSLSQQLPNEFEEFMMLRLMLSHKNIPKLEHSLD